MIDEIIDKWTTHGLGIAFRISCKETSTDRIEQQFATPRWVMEAGAKGGHYRMGKPTGPEGPWEPGFDDPMFLAKLDHFLTAFAARYDGKPWLRYVDIGSVGDWGEGHSWAGSQKECGLAARRQHVDLYLKHFKRAQIVASDDFVYALSDPAERQTLHHICWPTLSVIAMTAFSSTDTWKGSARRARCAVPSSLPTPTCRRRLFSNWSTTAP